MFWNVIPDFPLRTANPLFEKMYTCYNNNNNNFIFHYIKGYMFRPYNQVIMRPISKLSLQMLLLVS